VRNGDETNCTLVNHLSEDHSHPEKKRQAPHPIRALRLPLVSHLWVGLFAEAFGRLTRSRELSSSRIAFGKGSALTDSKNWFKLQ